jgi:hypothetical protein
VFGKAGHPKMSGAGAAAQAKASGQMRLLNGSVTKVSPDQMFCFVSAEGASDIYVGSQVLPFHALECCLIILTLAPESHVFLGTFSDMLLFFDKAVVVEWGL